MFHKVLNKEIIVNTAKELIEQENFTAFSMRKLAEKLDVKTASLYTHIESMEMLFTEIGLSALRGQRDCLLNAIGEKRGNAAVTALADGYRCFAAEHAELYKIIMQMPSGDDAVLKEAAAMTAEPFMQVLGDYRLTEEQKMHWQRVLRGADARLCLRSASGVLLSLPGFCGRELSDCRPLYDRRTAQGRR